MQTGRPLFFFSAGEPSGDIHAAELIRELKRRYPNADFIGCGGPEMQKAGCKIVIPLTKLAVMGIGRVLLNLPTFLSYLHQIRNLFRTEKPNAVILVDFPGFNWLVAKRARQFNIPVIYFMPPQLWAWAQYRVKKMKRLVNLVLCCLRFEEKWFRQKQVEVHTIGQPFFEEVRKKKLDSTFIESIRNTAMERQINKSAPLPLLILLPGSRDQEITNNFNEMLQTVEKIQAKLPHIYPVIAAFKESQGTRIKQILKKHKMEIPVYVGKTSELMSVAHCCLAVSGSVSLELLAYKKPTIIYYRIRPLEHFVFRLFCRVKYITLTNLIAVDRLENETIFYKKYPIPAEPSDDDKNIMVFPEYLTSRDRSSEVAERLISWFTNQELYQNKVQELENLLHYADQDGEPISNAGRLIEEFLKKNANS